MQFPRLQVCAKFNFCFLVDCKVIDNKFNRLHETTPISQISRVAAVEFPGRAPNWTNLTINVKISHLILSETEFCRFAQKNLHQSGENFTARVVGSCWDFIFSQMVLLILRNQFKSLFPSREIEFLPGKFTEQIWGLI